MNATIDKVKAWLTPGLLSLLWFFLSRDLAEIRADVKSIREDYPVVKYQVQDLQNRAVRTDERLNKLERVIALKPEDEYDIKKQGKIYQQ